MEDKVIIGMIGILSSAIAGIYGLLYKHVTRPNKHPCKSEIDDDIDKLKKGVVYMDVCEQKGAANTQAHEYLKEGIVNAIAQSDKQIGELKDDMGKDLDEIKELIRNNG